VFVHLFGDSLQKYYVYYIKNFVHLFGESLQEYYVYYIKNFGITLNTFEKKSMVTIFLNFQIDETVQSTGL